MAPGTDLKNDTIFDLQGQPLERGPAAFIKAVDKLLTVGAYYSHDHEQYRVVSENTCEQIVAAIGQDRIMAIEITASGMMVGSQLVDPNHRNVRLLHDLLVPLNISRFEISNGLTPSELRQAISALQSHKLNLGNTQGFQEIKIDNLPDTVSTASRRVVRGAGEDEDRVSLDELFGSGSPGDNLLSGDILLSDSEKLAREFMDLVNRILENLEKSEDLDEEGKLSAHPESTPENIKMLREALRRLVEVNPDPADLARLIEHSKRALDLSQDPGSVDLVFSLLRKEIEQGGDWKYKASEAHRSKPERDFRLTLGELLQEIAVLEKTGEPPEQPGPSARNNYVGICFHLLAADPTEALASELAANLEQVLTSPEISKLDLNLSSAAVATAVLDNNKDAVDRLLPAFGGPLREARPDYLAQFWIRIWETLNEEHRALVWPHLVGDLLAGLEDVPPRVVGNLWSMAGSLESRAAIMQVPRLECIWAASDRRLSASLWNVPLVDTYSVHLALMKSSLGPTHGPRLHDHLLRRPLNWLTEILMQTVGPYDPAKNGFYLSLIKLSRGDSISPDLRRMAMRLITDRLMALPPKQRSGPWALRAIGWTGEIDPDHARPFLQAIQNDRKFIFFKAWPRPCRDLAGEILAAAKEEE